MARFLRHCCALSRQRWENLCPPETGKGCSRYLQRWLPCPCETAWCRLVRTPSPPSEPGRAEQLWVETPHSCKTPHFASNSWARRPPHRSQWSSQRGLWDVFCTGAPPPESGGPGWCYTTVGWHQRGQRNLLGITKSNREKCYVMYTI